MTEYRHEAVEVCPHCMGENTVPDWAPEDGWRTTCKHCGERILLCDECIHSEDNPRAFATGVMVAASAIWETTRWLNGSKLSGRA